MYRINTGRKSRKYEQRRWERTKSQFKVVLEASHPQTGQPVIGPCITENLSSGGMALRSKHRLEPGQKVYVQIPTEKAPKALALPRKLRGEAIVKRVERDASGVDHSALSFSAALCESMELNLLVACLLEEAREPALN